MSEQKWIPVEERWPPDGEPRWTTGFNYDDPRQGRWVQYEDGSDPDLGYTTHWQPVVVPAPPDDKVK